MSANSSGGQLLRQPGKGLGLAFIGGMALSIDIPLIRLAASDPWLVMAARGFGAATILALFGWIFRDQLKLPKGILWDPDFLLVGSLSGLNNIFFTLAVFNTSAANVVFILAFNAMIAALMSWSFIGERPAFHTWVAIIGTIIGVGVIVSDSLTTGNWLGDVMALCCAFLLALSLTLTRRSGKDLSLAPGFGGLIPLLFALPMAVVTSSMPGAPLWLIADVFILVPLAAITLWLAPRFISAPEVALFYLLETVLAPLWIWWIFQEIPRETAFIGGALIIVSITFHALFELRRNRA